MVKTEAPKLLEAELSSPKWEPRVIMMSGVTDPYQPVEKKLKLTRRCLEVLAKFRNPVAMITKNRLITRDVDLLRELAEHDAVAVNISVTSLDPKLQHVLEPRTSPPQARLDTVAQLRAAGIPVGVMVAPIIPGLTDHEVPAILEACGKAGRNLPATPSCDCRGRSLRFLSGGSTSIFRKRKTRFWDGFAACAAAASA